MQLLASKSNILCRPLYEWSTSSKGLRRLIFISEALRQSTARSTLARRRAATSGWRVSASSSFVLDLLFFRRRHTAFLLRGCILTWRTCGRDEWWSVQACKKGKRQTYFLLGRELSILRILGENRETERLSAATIAQEVVVSATSKNYCYILPPTSQQLSTQLFRWERRRFGRHADPIPHCRQKLPEKNRRNSNSNKHNKEVSLASERLVLLCFGCPIFCLDSSSRSLGLASGLFFSILWQPENEQ